MKYFGIDLLAARVFKCSYDNAKGKFYRAFNAVFEKDGLKFSYSRSVCRYHIMV